MLVLRGRFREAPQAPEEIRPRRRQQVVAGELAARRQIVQQAETDRRAVRLGDRDGAVQLDYRRGVDPGERLVERGDRPPVGRSSVQRAGVLGGYRSLEQVPPDGRVGQSRSGREAALQRLLPAGDLRAIPAGPVLFLEQCDRAVRAEPRLAPRVLEKEQREQPVRLRPIRQQVGDDRGQPDGLAAELAS